MWIVFELYNDGMIPTISKFKQKEKAINFIKKQGYEMDDSFDWDTEKCAMYQMGLHTCFLFSPKNIEIH